MDSAQPTNSSGNPVGVVSASNSTSKAPQNADSNAKNENSQAANNKNPPTLSNKELKELKKKEKAAKRAAKKQQFLNSDDKNNAKPSSNQIKKQINNETNNSNATSNNNFNPNTNKQSTNNESFSRDKIISLFTHLSTKEERNQSSLNILHEFIHTSIIKLNLNYSNFKIIGSINRCVSMLNTFKIVINDYKFNDKKNLSFSRDLTQYLSYQIEFLKTSRPLSITMRNSIRWLKQTISELSLNFKSPIENSIDSQIDFKNQISEKIDDFIKNKIYLPQNLIINDAKKHISNDSIILTYGNSKVLNNLFIHCHNIEKKEFKLIIVDSRPLFEGKTLLNNLINSGFKRENLSYIFINAISTILNTNKIDAVFLGAHGILSNGTLYSRVGTAMCSLVSHKRNVPIIVCCESLKFTDKIQLDSLTQNEINDNDYLLNVPNFNSLPKKKNYFLEYFIKSKSIENNSNNFNNSRLSKQQQQNKLNKKFQEENELKNNEDYDPLVDYKNTKNLNLLNIMYDLTPAEYITKIVTEMGSLPPSSIPVVLKEYNSIA
ncbi:translation initiation factor eIF2B subunit delta [Ascoidea rubescens DSM 1968]|uniref:Translation initiation factor eIF2B subunit delta n=1 Tax=Ascoidea rubescens DSM 1968 TaxID=1344418 RepID=A0A1D2VRV1_9ASCO|nr:IF-2B-domain-containing protein [Ascoidea rubescens DSM 1968]ODV64320.1 IF-2B-domain-containing protein [Ascoidea rubescens DSM 1968]